MELWEALPLQKFKSPK